MKRSILPKNVQEIADDEQFSFACHNRVRCFTDCCRQLELSLTPYDVLRLKNALSLSSTDFLERYVIIEQDEAEPFPRCYLTMVDDGNASCVFVTDEGCSVYQDRPGPCRAYPMGRASMRKENNQMEQFFVLLHEEHCKGFEEEPLQTPLQYSSDQGLDQYNEHNDILINILQHEKIRKGMRLSTEQCDDFILALYDLDRFRKEILPSIFKEPLIEKQKEALVDDVALLSFTIDWLDKKLFTNSRSTAEC